MVAPDQALKRTVQDFEPKDSPGGDSFWLYFPTRDNILPAWGSRNRDRALREWYRDPHNGLVQGAFAGLAKRVASTPYVMSHVSKDKGSRKIAYYQELLNNAQFGDYGGGWRGFILRLLLDFLTQDFGSVCEIIGAGNPMGELTGPVQGVAHLDALRCEATGNPEFPIVYWSRRTNKLHRLHHTRVARFVDMPDGDEWAKGKGLSALSRMISVVKQQVLISKYNIERLDDLPPAGFLTLNNVMQSAWEDIKKNYQFDRESNGQTTWSNILALTSMDAAQKVEVNFVPFSTVPEHFSYREYTEMHVNAIALTLGVDPQDIWPLTGAPLGTGQQSQILASKARGKMFGDILTMLERFINWYILPPDMEFEFRYQDDEQDKTNAEIAQAQANVAQSLATLLGNTPQAREIATRYLAANVESFRNVLIDANGQLIRLPDIDPKADNGQQISLPGQIEGATADDNTPVTSEGTQQPATATPAAPVASADTPDRLRDNQPRPSTEKDIKTLLESGIITLADAQRMQGLKVDPNLEGLYLVERSPVPSDKVGLLWQSKFGRGVASFDTVISGTALEATTGTNVASVPGTPPKPTDAPQAAPSDNPFAKSFKSLQSVRIDFEDEFADMIKAAMGDEMARRRASIVARGLVSKYIRRAYQEGLRAGGVDDMDGDDSTSISGLVMEQSGYITSFLDSIYKNGSEYDEESRAAMWWNKSIQPAYEAGLVSADANGLYEWVYGDTEHCDDCKRLNGQRHRLKEWIKSGWKPQADKLQCKGFNCKCRWQKVKGSARGNY